MDDAAEYELDVAFDNTFEEMNYIGRNWFALRKSEKNWQALDGQNFSWDTIHHQPEPTYLYRGPGEGVEPSLPGYTGVSTEGLTCGEINARYMTWAEIHLAGKSWAELMVLTASHTKPHCRYTLDVPKGARYAYVRLRSLAKDGSTSEYLVSTRVEIGIERCLHIPTLYEGENATIIWNDVDWAVDYVLDVAFDSAFYALPTGPTVYRGKGSSPAVLPSPWGYMCYELEKLGLTWRQFLGYELDWKRIGASLPGGQNCGELDARCQTWAENSQADLSWRAFELSTPCSIKPHVQCAIPIPIGVRSAYFRLWAIAADGESRAILSAQRKIAQLEKVTLTTETGKKNLVLFEGTEIDNYQDIVFTMHYDQAHLALDDLSLWAGGYKLPLSQCALTSESKDGKLKFKSSRAIPSTVCLSGLSALLQMSAKQSGTTDLRLGAWPQ